MSPMFQLWEERQACKSEQTPSLLQACPHLIVASYALLSLSVGPVPKHRQVCNSLVQVPRVVQGTIRLWVVPCPQALAPWTARSPCQTSLGGTSCRTSCARCCAWLPTGCMTCVAGWTSRMPTGRRLRHRCASINWAFYACCGLVPSLWCLHPVPVVLLGPCMAAQDCFCPVWPHKTVSAVDTRPAEVISASLQWCIH